MVCVCGDGRSVALLCTCVCVYVCMCVCCDVCVCVCADVYLRCVRACMVCALLHFTYWAVQCVC